MSGVRTRGGDYLEQDLARAVNDGQLVGDLVEHWKRLGGELRTVAFAVNVEHSRAIVARFVAAGVAAEHLDGETPTFERDAILARLERGETLVVSNCGVLCEGWDQPSVKCCVLARPTKSTGLYLQQAGRVLRPWQGVRPIILDHAGNVLEHGLPQDDREFSLDATEKRAVRSARRTTKACPSCETIVPSMAQKCPECGAAFEGESREPEVVSEETAGELREVVAVDNAEMRDAWGEFVEEWHSINRKRLGEAEAPIKPGFIFHRFRERFGRKPPKGCTLPPEIATEAEKRAAIRELYATAKSRGYKPGWAIHRFESRFGHRPGAQL